MTYTYLKAIDDVKQCFYNDNIQTWWPSIIGYENGSRVHYINGVKAGSYGGCVSQSDSILRLLMDDTLICALFAFPASNGIGKIDMVVGYIDYNKNKILDSYSMIGRKDLCHEETSYSIVPKNAKWIIGASFKTDYRNSLATESSLCKHTNI
jgi:hypothetical protein